MNVIVLLLYLSLSTQPAWPPTPQTIWSAWNWEPAILLGILLPLALYLWGMLRRHTKTGRSVPPGQLVALLLGLAAIAVALVSPLDALSESLFSAHMVQHLLLLLVAPPLFVLARPLVVMLWALPASARRRTAHALRTLHLVGLRRVVLPLALGAWLLHAAMVWLWHTPLLYETALRNDSIHIVEHLCFFASALLLWWTVLDPAGGRRSYGISVLAVFLTALQGGILGALLTFSTTLWYPAYTPLTLPWGLTPLYDQQLAGVIMWVPSGLVYLGIAAWLFVTWLAAVERSMRRREPAAPAIRPLELRKPASIAGGTEGG